MGPDARPPPIMTPGMHQAARMHQEARRQGNLRCLPAFRAASSRGRRGQEQDRIEAERPSLRPVRPRTGGPRAARRPSGRSPRWPGGDGRRSRSAARRGAPRSCRDPRPAAPSRRATVVSGISGRFSRTPIGETRWNRRATSGRAASQTTADASDRLEDRRDRSVGGSLIHQGSRRRSSSSSGRQRPDHRRSNPLGQLAAPAMGRRHQPDQGADGQERELAAHVEEEERTEDERQRARPGPGCWPGGACGRRPRRGRTSAS